MKSEISKLIYLPISIFLLLGPTLLLESGNENINVTEIEGEGSLDGERLAAHFDDVLNLNPSEPGPGTWPQQLFDDYNNLISTLAIAHNAHVEVETQFEIENVHQITESDVILSEENDRVTGTESGVEVESNIARDDGVEVPSEVEVEVEVAMTHAIACPPGYESDVFYSLPEFMQQEILDQHEEENGSDQVRTLVESQGYDYETFSSLPESIRVEILDQARRDQATSTGESGMPPSDTANSQEMDNASFLVSLSAELRAEVLLTADAAFILSLPPELVAEAQMHRERAAAHWQQREIQQTRFAKENKLFSFLFHFSSVLIFSRSFFKKFKCIHRCIK